MRLEVTKTWLSHHVWESALRRVKDRPAKRREPDPLVAQLVSGLPSLSWPGRGGASEWAVYTALLAIASEVGLPVVNASQRRLMSKAGLASRQTVQRALKGLIVRGLIEPGRVAYKPVLPEDSPARHHWTGRWRVLPCESAASTEPSAATTLGERQAAHDAFFNRSGLGKNAHRVWDMLHGSPGELLRSRSLSAWGYIPARWPSTFRRCRSAGWRRADAAHWLLLVGTLNAVAADLGTYGRMVRFSTRPIRASAPTTTSSRVCVPLTPSAPRWKCDSGRCAENGPCIPTPPWDTWTTFCASSNLICQTVGSVIRATVDRHGRPAT